MKRLIWLVVLAQIFISAVQGARWVTIESAGTHAAREETTFSPCGGTKICLLGGRGRAPTPVLDTATLKWSNGPAPPIELHHFQGAVGPDGCAWIFGAWTGPFPNEVAVKDIYRYCADTKKWDTVGKMRRARGAGAVVLHEGSFYVATGNVGGHTESAKTVNWFEKYDPTTKVWTILPNVPHPRDHVGAAVFKNKLYLAGGRDSGGANYPDFFALTEPKVDVYDFATETWSTMREDFPAPRAGASVVIYGGSMWVAGGEGSGKAWDDVEILSGSRLGSRFQAGPKMPHPRHGFGMVSCNGVLWVAGGAGTEGGGASQTMLDAYHTGKKPKACRISVTAEATDAPQPTPVTEVVPEPTSPPASQPTPVSVPVAEDVDEVSATPEPGLEGVPVEVDDSESAEKPCFPASATVQLENGSIKKMSDLVVGDRVSVGKNQFSEVFMFTHKLSSVQYDFVQLETASGNALRLTDGHFLPINGEYLPAKHASVGDKLILADGSVSDIVSISSVQDYGLFNPQTTHGDIVVDGIQASTYTTAVSPNMAHALLAPLRTICSRFGMEMRFLESGAESVARFTSIAA